MADPGSVSFAKRQRRDLRVHVQRHKNGDDGSENELDHHSTKEEKEHCLSDDEVTYSSISFNKDSNKDEAKTGLILYDCYIGMKKKIFPEHVKLEARELMKLAWGICINSFFGFFIPVTMIFAIGQKGKVLLAGAGLGLSICNLTGSVYVIGITSVCETFFSQAYGAKQMRRYGIIMQRAFILTSLALLPSCALWINMDKILLKLGQDKEVAMLAGQFCIHYIPGIFCYMVVNLLMRFLACQNIVYPSVFGALVALVMNGICCYVFIFVFDLGVRGGALALNVGYFLFALVLTIFVIWKKLYKDTWYGFSTECLCEWKSFIALSGPSIVLSASEWLCFELGIISTGIIGTVEQASQIVLFNICGLIYFISLGISIATAVRVGHFIGSGHPESAKNSLKVSLMLVFVFTVLIGLLFIALQDVMVYLFTSDRPVIQMTSKLIYLIAIAEVIDGIEVVCMGAVRGLGHQKYGALVNFFAFICIGTLVYMLLMFKAKLGVAGFWIGVMIGMIFQNIGLFILLHKIDWKKLSGKVREKNDLSCNDVEEEASSAGYRDVPSEDSKVKVDAPGDVFFRYEPPQLKKTDLAIKLMVSLLLLLVVAASAVIRYYT